MRMGIEVADRQGFHMGEEIFTDVLHGTLGDPDHDLLVGEVRNDAQGIDAGHLEQFPGQRSVVLDGRRNQRCDVIIDQGSLEQGADDLYPGIDDNADHDDQNRQLVALQYIGEQSAEHFGIQLFTGIHGSSTGPSSHFHCLLSSASHRFPDRFHCSSGDSPVYRIR